MPDDLEPQPAAPPLDACAGALHCPPPNLPERESSTLVSIECSQKRKEALNIAILPCFCSSILAASCKIMRCFICLGLCLGGWGRQKRSEDGPRGQEPAAKHESSKYTAESDLSFFFQMDPASWLNARYTYCLPNSYHGNYLLQLLFNTALDQSFLLILFLFLLQFNTVHSQGSALLPFSSADSLSE
ncbi:hypothetical protein U9M48_003185 [Paspalum notatum var. saurae]|uniref:Uncharacterized protein n=1 Tax=Paspalum notatum var. saurae TaxID=547442 RepID=A0AAQ3PQL2_PASNO